MLRLLPLLLLFCSLGALAQGSFQPDERAYYGLIDRGSGRCLDVVGAGTNAGDAAVQWEFTHSNSQQWRFVPVAAGSEYFRIEAKHSTLCLTVPKPGEAVPLVQQPFQGGLGQQWRLVPAGPLGSFLFENRLEGRVAGLAAADKFNGTPMQAQKANGRASQQWHLFRLRLNVATGPGFGPREPLTALNSAGNEIGPVLAPDGQTLYFGRTKFVGNTEGNTDTGDAWAAQSPNKGKTWGPPQRLDALNTPQNNGVLAVVGAQGQTLLVRGTYNRDGFRDEGVSRVSRAAAGPPGGTLKNLHSEDVDVANYYTAVPATGFFMTADEKILLLSLERGDSEGGNDIYFSRPAGAGGYSAPESLGPVLNSPGFDFAPWLTPDGKTLYFSSYGHMGYGGADVFVSQRLDDSWTRWSEPQNLGPALNGPGFDAYFSLAADGETAYFASSATANASADLFRAGRAAPDTTAVAAGPAPVSEANRAFVSGRVLDARSRQPVPGATVKAVLLPNAQGVQFEATARTDAAGSFVLSLLAGRYRVVGASGLLSSIDTLAFAGNAGRDLLLRPAAVGEKVDLPTIIFAQGQAVLLGTSYTELNRLAIALQAESGIKVRLEGHTDNVGPADKNQQLSEDRVAEVKRYLVKRGVDESRISTAGYGGSRPRFANDREETRRLNRRVELVIVK
ncbi:RICIN domain-containing protein [Hymenobacter nivis]|nr:RICIN domain-containing protein [Hymenobacter nivis]